MVVVICDDSDDHNGCHAAVATTIKMCGPDGRHNIVAVLVILKLYPSIDMCPVLTWEL